MSKKKRKYNEPGLLPNGYEQDTEEAIEMSIYDEIEEAVAQRRDDQINKSGEGDKVYITSYAPSELKMQVGDSQIWLISVDPLTIKVGDTAEEIEVQPDWIILENAKKYDPSAIIRRQIDVFMGISEVDTGSPSNWSGTTNIGATNSSLAFSEENYSKPEDAYLQLKDTSLQVSVHKKIDIKTLKHFMTHVYKGGDHTIPFKKMVVFLKKKGIQIFNRRENTIAKLEKVKI